MSITSFDGLGPYEPTPEDRAPLDIRAQILRAYDNAVEGLRRQAVAAHMDLAVTSPTLTYNDATLTYSYEARWMMIQPGAPLPPGVAWIVHECGG